MRRLVWGVFAVVLASPGCSLTHRRAEPAAARSGATQEGIASWYGPGFHGNPTSSGEIYDQNDLTAAHKTLPLGTRVAVTNLDNGRSVEVRVNDRGPFVGDRVIDLSHAAARSLDMIGPGTVPVRVEVLGPHPVFAATAYAVQVGAFTERRNAERLRSALRERFASVYVSTLEAGQVQYYRVRLGRFAARDAAVREAEQAASLGLPAVIVEDGVAP